MSHATTRHVPPRQSQSSTGLDELYNDLDSFITELQHGLPPPPATPPHTQQYPPPPSGPIFSQPYIPNVDQPVVRLIYCFLFRTIFQAASASALLVRTIMWRSQSISTAQKVAMIFAVLIPVLIHTSNSLRDLQSVSGW